RITSCQFGALSQAYSSVSVTPCHVETCGRRSARGGSGRGAGESLARSSMGGSILAMWLLRPRPEEDSGADRRLFVRFAGRGKVERGAVHAIAQPGRLRPVGEDVAEMGLARRAADLGAAREPRAVVVLAHRLAVNRRIEARPAGAGLELRVRGEQRRPAAHAAVIPRAL